MHRKSKNKLVLLGMVGIALIIISLLIVEWLPKEREIETQPIQSVIIKPLTCDDICRNAGYLRSVKDECIDITECDIPFHPIIENNEQCTELKVCCCV